jgi:4,5-DOPA dioxygenase extradiol
MAVKMPVLFIGHGSPLNIILDNGFTRALAALGESLPRPKAIMVISAHWLTNVTSVTCMKKPKTIHDFYGFPEELYKIDYPCPGAPDEAGEVTEVVRKVSVLCDFEWGLDHASWAVLKHIYPGADIPVFEMSLDYKFNDWHPKPLQYHYDLGAELAELRKQGVLIIGSGNIVHNLELIDFEGIDAQPYAWAREFDEQAKEHLLHGNHRDLIEYRNLRFRCGLSVRVKPPRCGRMRYVTIFEDLPRRELAN